MRNGSSSHGVYQGSARPTRRHRCSRSSSQSIFVWEWGSPAPAGSPFATGCPHPGDGSAPRARGHVGTLTENLAHASCRDLLFHGIEQSEVRDHPVVLHVHDEVVVESLDGCGSPREVKKLNAGSRVGIQIFSDAEGWKGPRYRKG